MFAAHVLNSKSQRSAASLPPPLPLPTASRGRKAVLTSHSTCCSEQRLLNPDIASLSHLGPLFELARDQRSIVLGRAADREYLVRDHLLTHVGKLHDLD